MEHAKRETAEHPLEETRELSGARRKLRMASLAVALVVAGAVAFGSTSAWLVAKSNKVVNTFTYGSIDIVLAETETDDGDNDPGTNQYKMLPGSTIDKDPKLTVKAGGVDCWLFAKLEPSDNFGDFMEYDLADSWTSLGESAPGVVYREVSASESDQKFDILKDNKVTVKSSVTKRMLEDLGTSYPTLTVSAYAVQKTGFEAASAAWEQVEAP